MPATAGRVRMPANNRVHSSAALQTHGIWQSAIGYDPYAPSKDDGKRSVSQNAAAAAAAEPDAENAYASFQGLLALAKITNSTSDEVRGACKRCGRVGHLYVNCKNFLSMKDKKDDDLLPEAILKKLKGEKVKKRGESSSEEEDESESESSDSAYDSEIERILAKKAGKLSVERGRSKKRRSGKRDDDSDSEDEGRKRKRRKEKKRRKDDDSDDESSDEEEERRRRRKRKSRKERRRRRSHRHSSSDDEDSSEASPDERRKHKRRSKRADSDSGSGSDSDDDRRVGRDKKRRRSVKKSRKSRHEDKD